MICCFVSAEHRPKDKLVLFKRNRKIKREYCYKYDESPHIETKQADAAPKCWWSYSCISKAIAMVRLLVKVGKKLRRSDRFSYIEWEGRGFSELSEVRCNCLIFYLLIKSRLAPYVPTSTLPGVRVSKFIGILFAHDQKCVRLSET